MATSFKRTLIAAALLATTFASAGAEARPRGAGRGLQPPSGTGRLRNVAQAMCLDVAGWAAQGNSDVLAVGVQRRSGPCLVVHAQRRAAQRAERDLSGCRRVTPASRGRTSTCIAASRWTTSAGSWSPRGHGTFELRNVKRGLCLDVNGRAGARGDDVLLWACDGGADQLWSFEAYAPPQPRPAHGRQLPPAQPATGPRIRRRRCRSWKCPPAAPRARAVRGARARWTEGAFRALIAAVRNQSFSESQLAVIQQAVARNYFRVGQIVDLIDVVAFSASKLRVLELGAPRVVDPENAFAVYDAFAFSADKAQARQILRRNGF